MLNSWNHASNFILIKINENSRKQNHMMEKNVIIPTYQPLSSFLLPQTDKYKTVSVKTSDAMIHRTGLRPYVEAETCENAGTGESLSGSSG